MVTGRTPSSKIFDRLALAVVEDVFEPCGALGANTNLDDRVATEDHFYFFGYVVATVGTRITICVSTVRIGGRRCFVLSFHWNTLTEWLMRLMSSLRTRAGIGVGGTELKSLNYQFTGVNN